MKGNVVQEKSFQFALEVINLYIKLKNDQEYVLSKQLLRSGTSIGANVEEAIAGQSRNDFVSKMSIARKEARETRYWLRLLQASKLTTVNCSHELEHADELLRLLTAIIKSAKEAP
ncbi:MAG TPA: four helix bundle protein [Chloroflexia bacterium]|nr:four helix bundle protein [Chloroflexia bacterium]